MRINYPTAASEAAAVWANAVRTLTADPATDAGAAALIWAHAARALTVDPATDAGAAALIWAHAARALTADPATDAGAAALVWGHAARTLTQDNANSVPSTGRPSIASGSILSLQQGGATYFGNYSLSTATTGAMVPGLYDGANFDGVGTQNYFVGFALSTRYVAAKNTSGSAINIAYCGWANH